MEIHQGDRERRRAILVPVVAALLLLVTAVIAAIATYIRLPRLARDAAVISVVSESEGGELFKGNGVQLAELFRDAAQGEEETVSEKYPALTVTFSDGGVLKVSFSTRSETLRAVNARGRVYWLYSAELSRALSLLLYPELHPTPEPTPSPTPAVSP